MKTKNLFKRMMTLLLVMTGAVVAMAEDITYSPTLDVNFRTGSTSTSWNSGFPKSSADDGNTDFEQTYAAGFFALQKFTVPGIQTATKLVLTLTVGSKSGVDALVVWPYSKNDWTASSSASDLVPIVTSTVGIEPRATEGTANTPLATGAKVASSDPAKATWTIEGDALATVKANAESDGTFTLLITNNAYTNSNSKRSYLSSNSANAEANRPTLVASVPSSSGGVQTASVTTSTGDCWVRTDNASSKTGTAANMEVKTYTDGETLKQFFGVMSFQFDAVESGNEVNTAKLRLTTRVQRGDRSMAVYALTGDFDADNVSYSDISDNITAALATTPIATFTMEGNNNKALTDDGLAEAYQVISKWQNTIDLSDYVKTLSSNTFSILIVKTTDQNSSSIFYTKEATGITWNANINSGAAIADADIQPQLTVTYKQTGGGSDPTPTPTSDLTKDDSKTVDGTNSYTEVYTVGSGSNTVTVTVEKTADKDGEAVATHGTVTATGEISGDNVNVTLTVTPENAKHALDGNIIVELIAGDSNGDGGDLQLAPRRAISVGNFLTVTQNTDGTYSFTMASDASVIVTAKFKKLPAKPVVLPTVNYDADGNKVTIAMGTATSEQEPSVKMYYTTDGSDPRSSSTKVEATTTTNIDVTAAMTMVRVVSVDEEGNFSDVVDQAVSRRSFLTVSKEWVAFYSPATFTVPTGLKAYTISAVTAPADGTSGTVVLKEQTVIAKNTPMLIENTVVSTQSKFQITATDDVDIPAADVCAEFKGTATGTTLTANGSTYYVLKNGVFLRANPGTVSAYNCYLEIAADSGSPSNAPQYSIEKGGNTTGIKDSIADQKNDDNAWYTLSGVRMEKPIQRGIYIHNGKKVVVK